VKEHKLGLTTDGGAIRAAVEGVLAQNEKSVKEYQNGKTQALHHLIGQSMKTLGGQAPAAAVTKVLNELLNRGG
jgi:aspartyl-tRNA(Asn)/glutamyl-tRNA(Gln) amidotransferase subunit B